MSKKALKMCLKMVSKMSKIESTKKVQNFALYWHITATSAVVPLIRKYQVFCDGNVPNTHFYSVFANSAEYSGIRQNQIKYKK